MTAGRNAGFTALGVQLIPDGFAVVSFIADSRCVMQLPYQIRSGGEITDISGGDDDFRRQPPEGVHGGVKFRVSASSGFSNRLIPNVLRAIGVLMDFNMGAVKKDRRRAVSANQLSVEKVKKTGKGKTVEKLIHGEPVAEFGWQGAPRAGVEEHIPKSIEVIVPVGLAPACIYIVIVSSAELLDLIFLAAHGAEPAYGDDGLS